MKFKCLLSILMTMSISSVFADNNYQNSYADGTNLMNIQSATNLDAKFVSNKKMYQISDAKSVVKMLGLNLVVNGQSSQVVPTSGLIIVSNGTVRDYLNVLGDQFGYYWALEGSSVVFTPINPYIKPISTPVSAVKPAVVQPQVAITPAAQTQSISTSTQQTVAVKEVESNTVSTPTAPIIKTTVATPTTPIISETKVQPNKDFGVWEMKLSDKTVKKTFQRWAKEAGWQLIWNANVDFPISAEMQIEGDFDYAINEVCRASQYTNDKIIGEFHPKNKVIVITTQD